MRLRDGEDSSVTTSPPSEELAPDASEAAAVLEAEAVVAPPPWWVSPLFLILGIGLVPWTLLLAFTLPDHHGTNHYNLAWTGFDVVLAAFLIATAVGTARRAAWLQSVAAVAAALLVCDAWFDVLSSTTTNELVTSIALAVFVELP